MASMKNLGTTNSLNYLTSALSLAQGVFYINTQTAAAICLILGGFALLPLVSRAVITRWDWIRPIGLSMLCHLAIAVGLIGVVLKGIA